MRFLGVAQGLLSSITVVGRSERERRFALVLHKTIRTSGRENIQIPKAGYEVRASYKRIALSRSTSTS